jgi:hypothetical protein
LRTARRSRIYVMRGIVFAYCLLTRGRESMMMSYIAFLVTSDGRADPLAGLARFTRVCADGPRARVGTFRQTVRSYLKTNLLDALFVLCFEPSYCSRSFS